MSSCLKLLLAETGGSRQQGEWWWHRVRSQGRPGSVTLTTWGNCRVILQNQALYVWQLLMQVLKPTFSLLEVEITLVFQVLLNYLVLDVLQHAKCTYVLNLTFKHKPHTNHAFLSLLNENRTKPDKCWKDFKT